MNRRTRLLVADIAFAAVFILCAVLCVTVFLYQSDAKIHQQNKDFLSLAERDTAHINHGIGLLMDQVDAILQNTLNSAAAAPLTTDTLQRALNDAPFLISISLIDPQGNVVASTKAENIGHPVNLGSTPVLPLPSGDLLRIGPTHAGNDLADGIPLTDNTQRTPERGFIPITRTRLPESRGQDISLVATVGLKYLLNKVIQEPGVSPETRIAVLRTDGLRLLDTQPADSGLLQFERTIIDNWQKGSPAESGEFETIDAKHWLATYLLHPQLPLGVVLAIDSEILKNTLSPSIQRDNMTISFLMIVGMACVLFAYLFFRYAGRHQRERLLKIESQRNLLEKTLNACANAIVITRKDSTIEWCNPAFTTLAGYTTAEAIGKRPGFLTKSGKHDATFYSYLWQTILSGQVWRGEIVNRRKDGSLYNERLTISPVFDNQGDIQHFIATKEDFSEQKAAVDKLEVAHSHLNAVVENFPGSIIMEDTQGDIVLINQNIFDLLGLPGTDEYVLGKPIQKLMEFSSHVAENAQAFLKRIDELRAAARPFYGEEIHFKDGRWVERDFVPIRLHGNLLGFLYIYRDISQRKRHARELWQLATSDPLTGIPNRRAFFESFEHERARLTRYPGEAALLMVDIDHFKQINDTHGHGAGDAMLCHIVRQIRKLLRGSDTLARLGGEEFAILLPQANKEGALLLAERVRKVIEDTPLIYNDADIYVTASVGVAIMSHNDPNIDKTLSRADHALYKAKHSGRNRVEFE
ncbi:MAG: diguanylate cyclase [Azoarcus sp.]|jgi:diguanylate cyclase (GGDEF)-like protein/PAS domain S-box-containing protein|nr:diguanylate cyclase [Azoarcus sp.]